MDVQNPQPQRVVERIVNFKLHDGEFNLPISLVTSVDSQIKTSITETTSTENVKLVLPFGSMEFLMFVDWLKARQNDPKTSFKSYVDDSVVKVRKLMTFADSFLCRELVQEILESFPLARCNWFEQSVTIEKTHVNVLVSNTITRVSFSYNDAIPTQHIKFKANNLEFFIFKSPTGKFSIESSNGSISHIRV